MRAIHLLHHALLQDVGQGFVSRLHPGIFPDAGHGRGPPFRGSLLIEQHSQPAEYPSAGIEIIHFVGAFEVLLSELQFDSADYDLEVLRDFLLFLLPHGTLQGGKYGLGLLPLLVFIGQRRLRHVGVELT